MAVVVLAYAGRRNDLRALERLAPNRDAEVVTVTLDVGQHRALEDVREQALARGAARAHVIDARDRFAREFLWPALSARALQPGDGLGHVLVAPLVAHYLAQVAELEGAALVAHGASSPAGVERLAHALRALAPGTEVATPAVEWRAADEDTPAEGNLWERPAGGEGRIPRVAGSDEDPSFPPSATIDVVFADGVPIGLNGVSLDAVELIATLQTIAAAHGVGRLPSPGAPETTVDASAAVVLCSALAALHRKVLPPDLDRLSTDLGRRYAALIEEGGWFGLARTAIEAFAGIVRRHVAGDVAIRLFAGRAEVVSARIVPADPHGAARPAS